LKFAKQEAAVRIGAEFAPLVKFADLLAAADCLALELWKVAVPIAAEFADPTAAAECPAPASWKVAGPTATIRSVAAGWELALTIAEEARRASQD
jgi:hypothetical protein